MEAMNLERVRSVNVEASVAERSVMHVILLDLDMGPVRIGVRAIGVSDALEPAKAIAAARLQASEWGIDAASYSFRLFDARSAISARASGRR